MYWSVQTLPLRLEKTSFKKTKRFSRGWLDNKQKVEKPYNNSNDGTWHLFKRKVMVEISHQHLLSLEVARSSLGWLSMIPLFLWLTQSAGKAQNSPFLSLRWEREEYPWQSQAGLEKQIAESEFFLENVSQLFEVFLPWCVIKVKIIE